MAPCLSKLPSVCLEGIFKHVPLIYLLRSVCLVSATWLKSVRTELKRRRRMVIVGLGYPLAELDHEFIHCSHETELIQHVRRDDGSPWLSLESFDQIEFNALVLPGGIVDIPFTCSLLSNITRLTLAFQEDPLANPSLTHIIRLIDHYSRHLVELKLQTGTLTFHDTATVDQSVNSLFVCLNGLPALRHLRLDLEINIDMDQLVGQLPFLSTPPPVTFLTRLTTFAFRFNVVGHELDIDWNLASLAQNGQIIESIQLYNKLELLALLRVDPQLDGRITVLAMESLFDDFVDMQRFCTRFSSLTILKLYEPSLPITILARALSLLPQLVHLGLCFEFDPPPFEEQQPEITQVRTVRLLSLTLLTESHHDSERLLIADIFPNLQVLRFKHYWRQCRECALEHGPRIRLHGRRVSARLAECARLTKQPLRRCANLRIVEYSFNGGDETVVNIEDL